MKETTHRRFAVAVVATLDEALLATRQLVRNELDPQTVSLVGQQASFAREQHKSLELVALVNGKPRFFELTGAPSQVVSLACEPDLPKMISENSKAFERLLSRWLFPSHAKRLTDAIAAGEFLLLVALHSMVEERIAIRTLLRSCRGFVEVHDLNAISSTEEFCL